jgi:hypothetical protein
MQPAANPDDIHAILSRFQTWAEQPANGNGNGHKNGATPLEGVREIPTKRRSGSTAIAGHLRDSGAQPRHVHRLRPFRRLRLTCGSNPS